MVHRRRFVRESLGYAFSQYLARVLLLLRGLVAAWKLGPAGYGGWNALNLILDYGAYASLGVLYGLDLKLPGAVERGEPARAEALSRGAWTMALTGGVLFTAAVGVYLATGDHELEVPWGWGPPALMLAVALLQSAIAYHASVLRAHGKIPAVSAAGGLQAVVGGGLGMALIFPLGIWGLLEGWLAGQVLALLWLRRAGAPVPLRPDLRLGAGELLGAGFPIFGFFVASLVLRSADRIAFLRYLGTDDLGLYSLGLMAAALVLYLPEAAGYVLYPRVAAASHGARDPELTRAQVVQVQRALCVLLPAAVGVGAVCAEPLVHALLPAYVAGVLPLRILSCAALALSAATVPSYYLLGTGREKTLMACGALAAAVTAGLVFAVAAHVREPAAVALAAAAGYLFFAVLLLAVAAPSFEARWPARAKLVATSLAPALWSAAVLLAVLRWRGSGAGVAAVRSLLFLAGYAPVLALLGRGVGLRQLFHEFLPGARPQAAA